MEAASASETSVNFYQAKRRCNPVDSYLKEIRTQNRDLNYGPRAEEVLEDLQKCE